MTDTRGLALAVVLASLMLLAPISGVAGTAGTGVPASATIGTDEIDDDQVVDVTDDVAVWDRTPLSLRANTSDGDVVVENLNLQVQTPEIGPAGMERSELAVFESGSQLSLEFGESDNVDTSQIEGEDVQILRGYLEEDADASAFPTSFAEFQDELTEENLDNINGNVSFSLDESQTLDDDGRLTYDDTPEESGFYTYVFATGEGLDVEDDDLSIVGETTIVGVEQVVAHDEPSEVETDDEAEPGDDIEFDVDATAIDGNTTHAVVLYDEDTFAGSSMLLNVTEQVDADLSAEDVTIEHEIAALNGVQNLEGDVDLFGETIAAQNESGLVEFADLVALLSDDVQTEVDGEGLTLDASSTILPNAEPDAELTVETFENWSASDTEYRWIHTATGSSSDQIQTSTGTITFDDSDGGFVPPPAPPTDPKPEKPEYEISDVSLSDAKIDVGDSVDVTATIAERSGDTGGTFTAELTIDGEVVDERDVSVDAGAEETVTFTETFDEAGEYEIEVSGVSAGTLTVGEKPPEKPGEPAFDVIDVSMNETEIEVGDSVDVTATVENDGGESGTFTAELTIDGEVVDDRDVTIPAGDTTTVTFTERFDEAGEFEIGVSGTSGGTLTVEDSGFPISGFGTTVALVALLSVALLAARRQG